MILDLRLKYKKTQLNNMSFFCIIFIIFNAKLNRLFPWFCSYFWKVFLNFEKKFKYLCLVWFLIQLEKSRDIFWRLISTLNYGFWRIFFITRVRNIGSFVPKKIGNNYSKIELANIYSVDQLADQIADQIWLQIRFSYSSLHKTETFEKTWKKNFGNIFQKYVKIRIKST